MEIVRFVSRRGAQKASVSLTWVKGTGRVGESSPAGGGGGAVAGVFAGLFGIGGGIIIVPALILLAGFPLVRATGTSLAAILLPVGILGVIAYHRARIIDLRAAAFIAAGLLPSVVVGAWLANTLPVDLMRRFFALFCLYISWNFIDPIGRVRA